MDPLLIHFPHTAAGFVVGFVVGLSGVGGGSLMTPVLVSFFGIKASLAVGTDLLYAAFTKGGGIWVHHRRGGIRWRIVLLLAYGSLPAALATVLTLRALAARSIAYEGVLTATLGVALILTSAALLGKRRLTRLAADGRLPVVWALHGRHRPLLTILAGALLGVLVTLSSVGAGALGTTLLFLLYPELAAVRVVGTDLAYAVPLTLVAGLGHLSLGGVDLVLLVSLLAGSLPGVWLGSRLCHRLPEDLLRIGLACMLMAIGLRYVLGAG